MSISRGHGHELLPKPVAPSWRRWVMAHRQAWVLVLGVLLVVGGWRTLVLLQRPAAVGKLTREFGSVAEFWLPPAPNPAGTRVLYQQATERGVGIFWSELPQGRRVMLQEKPEQGLVVNEFLASGWSPDGRLFAYARRRETAAGSELVIGDGHTGGVLATVPVARGVLRQLVWLSAESLVYADNEQNLYRVERLGPERWQRPQPLGPPEAKPRRVTKAERSALPPIHGLTAATPKAVLFLREQAIWNWETDAAAPVPVWTATTNKLVGLSRDWNGRQFLLETQEGARTRYYRFNWPTRGFALFELGPVPAEAGRQVVWLKDGGQAWLQGATLRVQTHPGVRATELEFNGGVNSLVGNQRELYLTGSRAGEPVAIWKYDWEKDALSCVVSNPQSGFQYARPVGPVRGSLTNQAGRVFSYRLWVPPRQTPGRKCPLLIGQLDARWLDYPGLLANGGAYVLSVDHSVRSGAWGEAVPRVLEHLKQRLPIDPEQVFLFGRSGETGGVCAVLESQPELWRGAILFSPSAVPDLRRMPGRKLLLDCGSEDAFTPRALAYREEAAGAGIAVTVVVHEGAGHSYRSIPPMRKRNEALMKFVFGR